MRRLLAMVVLYDFVRRGEGVCKAVLYGGFVGCAWPDLGAVLCWRMRWAMQLVCGSQGRWSSAYAELGQPVELPKADLLCDGGWVAGSGCAGAAKEGGDGTWRRWHLMLAKEL
ncbi:hypothetical protein Taro_002799 [Colocasia esculenta]|uniref:Uncharacterized protein n=1 Tax=Colocasia esculenta TaxID=4460 RepID=A0A843TF84_COLES|nr:hypothetical protein [Colocasia esculenta]